MNLAEGHSFSSEKKGSDNVNINYTANAEKLVDGTKIATTRFNVDHWRTWICNRKLSFMKFLGSSSHCCNENSINDYLSNVCLELFNGEKDGRYFDYRPSNNVPKDAKPQLKAWYGSFRNVHSHYKPKFLGDKVIFNIKIRPIYQYEEIDAIEDGFPDVDSFVKKLSKLHKKDLKNIYGSLEEGLEQHSWIQMRYVWLTGPINIPIPSKTKW